VADLRQIQLFREKFGDSRRERLTLREHPFDELTRNLRQILAAREVIEDAGRPPQQRISPDARIPGSDRFRGEFRNVLATGQCELHLGNAPTDPLHAQQVGGGAHRCLLRPRV
jgi:hypothetical protein